MPPNSSAPSRPSTGNQTRLGLRAKQRDRKCVLCIKQVQFVDYKNLPLLTRYLSNFARILPRRLTGTCQKHQGMIEQALKRARFLALMPYTLEHRMPEGKGPK